MVNLTFNNQGSVSSKLSTTTLFGDKRLGHAWFDFTWETSTKKGIDRIKLKLRGDDNSAIRKRAEMYTNFDPSLGEYFRKLRDNPYAEAAKREASVLELQDPVIQQYTPLFLLAWRNKTTKMTGFATEYLSPTDTDLMDISELSGQWKTADIQRALDGMAHMHSHFLGKWQDVQSTRPIGKFLSSNIDETVGWYRAKAESSIRNDTEVFTPERIQLLDKALALIDTSMRAMDDSDLTFCHGNTSIRNVCMRGQGEQRRVCMYDWELATIHTPARDVMEFLNSLSTGNLDGRSMDEYIEYYRQRLEERSGRNFSKEDFDKQVNFAASCIFFETLLTRWVRGPALREGKLPQLVENWFDFMKDRLV